MPQRYYRILSAAPVHSSKPHNRLQQQSCVKLASRDRLCWFQTRLTIATTSSGTNNNKKSAAQITSNEELSTIVRQFPPAIDYAFGYGSAVLRQQPSGFASSPHSSSNDSNSDPQTLSDSNSSMVDIILAVPEPYSWHKTNLQCHPNHYSWLARVGGPRFVTWLQVNFGAKLYFHPYVDVDINLDVEESANQAQDQAKPLKARTSDSRQIVSTTNDTSTTKATSATPKLTKRAIQRQIKYGVISTDDLIRDLISWDYLYLAGRMHKPIALIDVSSGSCCSLAEPETTEGALAESHVRRDEIEDAQRTNLLAAVSASLLLLGGERKGWDISGDKSVLDEQSMPSVQSLPTHQLYSTIASLSYTGDFRMQTGAEDPNKVRKLVQTPGMLDLWEDLYFETLDRMQHLGLLSVMNGSSDKNGMIVESLNHDTGGNHLEINLNDIAVRKQLMQYLPPRLRQHSDRIIGSVVEVVGTDPSEQGSLVLRQELTKIVAPAAKSQGIKGFFSAGISKSWKYALAKFAKGRLRK